MNTTAFAAPAAIGETTGNRQCAQRAFRALAHLVTVGVLTFSIAFTQGTIAASAATSDGLLHYGGGPIVTGPPRVYLVFWGSAWGTAAVDGHGDLAFSGDPYGGATRLQEMFRGLGTAGELWSGVMTQYCQGVAIGASSCPNTAAHVGYPTGGALAWVYYDDRAAPTNATADQIAAEAYYAATTIGDTGAAAQYVIMSPTRYHPDGFGVTNTVCAWHGYVNRPNGPAFTNLPYVMDLGSGHCGMGQVLGSTTPMLDGYTVTASHEYAETLTDPVPTSGWDDPADGRQGENGDKCPPEWGTASAPVEVGTATGTFALSTTWSNETGSCASAHAILPIYTSVPNLMGDGVTLAGQALSAAGLVSGSKSYKVDCNNIGLVTSQRPIAGTRVVAGSAVNITIGTKPTPPTVCP